jgi:hypothetical protein
VIFCAICGLERSGTTLISELLRQVPGVDAGFEIGVLLGATPRDFLGLEPYASALRTNWDLSEPTLAYCCDTDDFGVFYGRLRAATPVLRPGTRTIFDKTPRYLTGLTDCMEKVSAPFIVTYKDPRSVVFSDFKISGAADFDRWLETYAPEKLAYMRLHYEQFQRARAKDSARVCLVRLEELCLRPRETCTRLFAHVGVHFHVGYLAFRTDRFPATRAGSITVGAPFEYMTGLGVVRCRRVARVFAEFGEWFFE